MEIICTVNPALFSVGSVHVTHLEELFTMTAVEVTIIC